MSKSYQSICQANQGVNEQSTKGLSLNGIENMPKVYVFTFW